MTVVWEKRANKYRATVDDGEHRRFVTKWRATRRQCLEDLVRQLREATA